MWQPTYVGISSSDQRRLERKMDDVKVIWLETSHNQRQEK